MIRWPTWLTWPPWAGEERRAQQRQVMAVGTVLLSINAVVFNLLPNPGYDAPLLFVVAGLLCWSWAWPSTSGFTTPW